VIVAGKQPALQYLGIDNAAAHCARGIGIWEWAGSPEGEHEPDVVLGCAGDVPTLETLAAAAILKARLPDLRVRVINVVDLMRLKSESEHPHGLPDREFDALFTADRPIIFAYHGYPWLIHRLTYRAREPPGSTRARLQGGGHDHDAVRHGHAQRHGPLPPRHGCHRPRARARLVGRAATPQDMVDERLRHRRYTREVGDDMPDVRDWTWPAA
jgi:xylulose-5-phosphate/fructose-6-phosphate phosphoketolase